MQPRHLRTAMIAVVFPIFVATGCQTTSKEITMEIDCPPPPPGSPLKCGFRAGITIKKAEVQQLDASLAVVDLYTENVSPSTLGGMLPITIHRNGQVVAVNTVSFYRGGNRFHLADPHAVKSWIAANTSDTVNSDVVYHLNDIEFTSTVGTPDVTARVSATQMYGSYTGSTATKYVPVNRTFDDRPPTHEQ